MKPAKVLVTGAGGFLGCRLVERLLLGEKASVRAMAHHPSSAARLARLPVEIVWADLTDADSVERALQGCDVVVHCAYGTRGGRRAKRKVTVDGTRLLAEAALTQGVRRFVHISTVAVYSYSPPAQVDEETSFVRSGNSYCDDKIAAEEVVWEFVRKENLPATVLRMGNIWGPFSAPWTVRPLSHIHDGYVTLVDEGNHASNAVFVDNAVEAILLAIKKDTAIGEAFFVTDDETNWRTWYGRYATWLAGAPLLSINSQELAAVRPGSLVQKLRLITRDVRSLISSPEIKHVALKAIQLEHLGTMMYSVWNYLPEKAQARFKDYLFSQQPGLNAVGNDAACGSRLLPPFELLQIYAGRAVFSNEKAKRLLGYGPLISFDQASQITECWARWARLV